MGFERCHPAVNLIYFTAVIGGTVCFRHPVYLAISLCSAFLYSVKRKGRRAVAFGLCLVPLVVALGLFYSSYHHFGVTNLRQNFIGNQITLESLVYGLALGCTLAGVAMWMSCVYSVFSADKVVYLLGRVSRRLTNGLRIFSILITWTVEALAAASESMRSRGSGRKGRTAFSIYRFDNRDRGFVMGLFTCLTVVWMGVLLGQTRMRYNPRIMMNPVTPVSWVFFGAYALLCLLPVGLEVWTEYRFHRARRMLL